MWGGLKTQNQLCFWVFWLGQVEGPWSCGAMGNTEGEAESEREHGEFSSGPTDFEITVSH